MNGAEDVDGGVLKGVQNLDTGVGVRYEIYSVCRWRRQICWARHDGQEQGRMRLQTTTENCYLPDRVYRKRSNLNGSCHGSIVVVVSVNHALIRIEVHKLLTV
jgi:hypothetical protein